jgi:hypothetical protein
LDLDRHALGSASAQLGESRVQCQLSGRAQWFGGSPTCLIERQILFDAVTSPWNS